MSKDLWTSVVDNVSFVLVCVVVAVILFAGAYIIEKLMKKRTGDTERILSTRKIAMVGLFSAIGAILMWFEFPVPFAPPFYEMDFSELPVLLGSMAFGPVAGVMIEFCKNVLKILIKGTSTAFVGDLANFVIGCSFVLPASIIYMFKKTKKNAIVAMSIGTISRAVFGSIFNAVYLLPAFVKLYGMSMEQIIAMGTAVNKGITDVTTLCLFAVVPVNLLKGFCASAITLLIYKKLSPILKEGFANKRKKVSTNQ